MKRHFKRGLSVFMAALMLMTSWVFFAPEKAEAVTTGQYTLYFGVWVENAANSDTPASLEYGYYENNGKGTALKTGTKDIKNDVLEENDKQGKLVEIPITMAGFPVYLRLKASAPGFWGMGNKIELHVKSITIGNKTVIGERGRAEAETISNGHCKPGNGSSWDFAWKAKGYAGEAGASNTENVNGWTYPKATTASIDSHPGNVTIPTSGTASTTFKAHVKDQYGVKIGSSSSGYTRNVSVANTDPASFTLPDSQTGISVAYSSTDANSDKFNISVTNDAKKQKIDSFKEKATVTYTFNGGTASVTTNEFTVTDPKYAFKLNPNGGKIWHSNRWFANQDQYSVYYYSTLSSTFVPSKGERDGYEFIGMYTSSNKNSYNLTKPTAGSGSYAGQLTTSTRVDQERTWYAAWWARNYDVTFQIDGQPITTTGVQRVGKYDQKLNVANGNQDYYNKIQDITSGYQKTGGTFTLGIGDWIVASAKDANGNDINSAVGQSIKDYVIKGPTVFQPKWTAVKNYYTVKFLAENGNTLINKEDYSFNETITQPAAQTKSQDNTYNYVFKGWAVRPADDTTTNVHFVNAEGKDESGKLINVVPDNEFVVKNDVTYVPVFERIYKNYVVTFEDFLGHRTEATYHYGDVIKIPEAGSGFTLGGQRYTFIGWFDEQNWEQLEEGQQCIGSINYIADYTTEPAVYTIKFIDDYTGLILNDGSTQYPHGTAVTSPDDKVTKTYRDGEFEYTFTGWQDKDGNAFNPTAGKDCEYHPVYSAEKLYNVNFYNGDVLVQTAQGISGASIANVFTEATPTKADDKYATGYTFKNWVDAENNEVTAIADSDLNLYANYDFTVIDYTVEFCDDDKTTISKETYHYGDPITVPADPSKATDETYSYTFKGWDKDVNPVCEDNVVYTATYRRTYVLYEIEWLDEDGNPLQKQNYIYNERINPPIAPESKHPSTDPNYTNVFEYWVKVDEAGNPILDAEGNEIRLERGDRISGKARYKAVYGLEAKICEIKLYDEDGTTLLQTLQVPYGKATADLMYTRPVKVATADEHYHFTGWKTMDDAAISWPATITEDASFKASYTAAEHTFEAGEITKAPTFEETGTGTEICRQEDCGFEREITIPMLVDEINPEIKIYVRNHTWSYVGGANETNTGDIEKPIPAALSNLVVINTNDLAAVDTDYNKDGKGSGTKTIEYQITNKKTDVTSDWLKFYDYDELDAESKGKEANVTGTLETALNNLRDLCGFELNDGDVFNVSAKVVDRMGNQSELTTDDLKLDTQFPQVSVSNADLDATHSKFCEDATITVVDSGDITSIKLDGEEVKDSFTKNADNTLTKKLTEKGIYQVVVADVAGNETKLTFEIIGQHTRKDYLASPTCDEPGSLITVCTICNKILNRETKPALGHDWDYPDWATAVHIDATCVDNGYKMRTCRRCGEVEKQFDDPATTAGHKWVENTALRKPATCSATGVMVEECSVCHITQITTLPIDTDAHSYYKNGTVTTEPDCINPGVMTYQCKYDRTHTKTEEIPALGHDEGKWEVVTEATCFDDGLEILKCTRCGVELDRMEVGAHGHSMKLVETIPPTDTTPGYYVFRCEYYDVCHEEVRKQYTGPISTYTVTFNNEDGTKITSIDRLDGETIIASAVEAPTKAADDTYTYKFDGWQDENGKKVVFPLTVTKDMTLTPIFAKKYVSYIITLYKDATTQYRKIGYLHNDENLPYVLPTDAPAKESDTTNDYKFIGWSTDGTKENIVKQIDKFTADTPLEYYPVYEAVAKQYNVTYAYDTDNVIVSYKVDAGTDATNLYTEKGNATPTKASDINSHYVFASWKSYSGGTINDVHSDMLMIATFNAVEHEWEETVKQEADCLNPQITHKKCKTCAYEYDVKTADPLGHAWGTPDEHGVSTCTRCGATTTDGKTYTVTFYDEDGTTIISQIAYIKYGEDIAERVKRITPTKEADNEFIYEFDKWTPEATDWVIKADASFKATYKKTPRKYTVIFAYDSKTTIKTYSNVPVMDDYTTVYDLDAPVKTDYDAYGHYVFDGWIDRGVDNEHMSIYFEARFRKVDHTFTEERTDATCTDGAGITRTCACGYSYVIAEGAPLGHKWVLKEHVDPDYGREGYDLYICERCGIENKITYPAKQYWYGSLTLLDTDGHPVDGAKVNLFDASTGVLVCTSATGSNGVVTFRVPEGERQYTMTIEAAGLDQVYTTVAAKRGEGTKCTFEWVNGAPVLRIQHCECTCHRSGVWPNVFRWFHEIIYLITREYKCCNNPDPAYKYA